MIKAVKIAYDVNIGETWLPFKPSNANTNIKNKTNNKYTVISKEIETIK